MRVTTSSILTAMVLLIGFMGAALADQVALPLDIQDGLENMWSIQKDGSLKNAAPFNYKSKGAARLSIDDTPFPAQESATRTVTENGIEIQIGPKVIGSVHVTRKLFFGKGEGHVRFLEVKENRSTTPVSIKVSTMPIR